MGVGVAEVDDGVDVRLGLDDVDSLGEGLGEKNPDCEIRNPTKAKRTSRIKATKGQVQGLRFLRSGSASS